MNGKIHRIHTKPEKTGERGLPKSPVPSVAVTPAGVGGDFNRWRHEKDADNPDQAVLLMTLEMIHVLNAEGWPIKPGDLGENFTTEGIKYDDFQVGRRYALGKEVEIEISKACDPCNVLFQLPYVGAEIGPNFLKTLNGRRGWYARVAKPGKVSLGDVIKLLD